MRYQSGIQILLIIVAIIIGVAVINPELEMISQKQNQLAIYNDAIEKADAYNRALQEKINIANSLQTSDLALLNRFLPSSIDAVAVSKDLTSIVEGNNMLLQDITVGEVKTPNVEVGQSPVAFTRGDVGASQAVAENDRQFTAQTFKIEAIGSYGQLKDLLQAIERNAYPLTVTGLTFSSQENAEDAVLFTYEIEVETYALRAQ